MPDSSHDVFHKRINDILNAIQTKNQLNIALSKFDVHKLTSSLFHVLYSYDGFPGITKPTKVKESSATSSDPILTLKFCYWCFTSARYIMLINFRPFHVAGNVITNDSNMINPIVKYVS